MASRGLLGVVHREGDHVDPRVADKVYHGLRRLGQDPGWISGHLFGHRLSNAHCAYREIRHTAQPADATTEVVEPGAHAQRGQPSNPTLQSG